MPPPPHARPTSDAGRRFLAALCRPAGAAFVLLLAALVAYGGSLKGEFLWDDTFLVERNPLIRSPALIPEAFRHFLFVDTPAPFYRPIQTLSYLADYTLWGLEPTSFRLTNLLLHAAVGWGVYLLGRRLLPRLTTGAVGDGAALGIALIWVVHPVHNAAVAYVAGRADSLAAGFALLAWVLFEGSAAATQRSRPLRVLGFATAAVSLLAALLSKEMATVWIAFFGLRLLVVPDGLDRANRWRAFTGALLCLGIYVTLRLTLPSTPPGLVAPTPPVLASRALLMARALGDYAGLLLWPGRLCMERQVFAAFGPGYNPQLDGYYAALTFAGPACLALLVGLAAWPGPARRLRIFGGAWFLIGFLPVSNLFVLNASVAEHWLYVPAIGVLFLGVGGLLCFVPTPRTRAVLAALILIVALPVLTWRTARRAEDWTSRARFIPQTLANGGDSPRMRNMFASLLGANGDLAGSEQILRALLAQAPRNASAALNLANNLRRQDRPAEAGTLLTGIAEHPSTADPRPLPLALNGLDELDSAGLFPWPTTLAAGTPAEALDAALRRCPQSWDLLRLRVDRLARREGQPEEANQRLEEYLRVCPWNYAAWVRLAEGRAGVGDAAGTLEAYAHAGRLDIRETASWLRRALLLDQLNRPEEAREMLRVARERGSTIPAASP